MDKEKIIFVLKVIGFELPSYIDNVLNDSKEDPHYSAVHTSNLIKCYIELMMQFGEKLPYHDVKSYISFEGYSKKEYEAFEASRKKESEYYKGEQF